MTTTLRPIRERALNDLSAVITAEWGERCARSEAGCATCAVWALFDTVERLTEGSSLDDEAEFKRMAETFHLLSTTAP